MNRPLRILLTGFSGTGKSAVAGLVAERLDWDAIDCDDEIERAAGKPIPRIFAEDGEPSFRALESRVLGEALRRERVVIATGGGAAVAPANRRAMASAGLIVCLEARPETIHARLSSSPDASERPLLAGDDPMSRIRALKSARQPVYALADATVHTDSLSPPEVAAAVVRAWEEAAGLLDRPGRVDAIAVDLAQGPAAPAEAAFMVRTPSATYPVYVEHGGLWALGRRLRDAGLAGAAWVVSDDNVFPLHGEAALASIREAGLETGACVLPAGETHKTLATAQTVYDWLVERRAERGHAIVALGGGVVGDLAGFVAATYLRGVPLVQVPTTLLAMVDAAIGGKVAVDHPHGKNLIGAFYQPRFVLGDVATLGTLPRRELIAGLAETIKHGFIRDPSLLDLLERRGDGLLALEPEATLEIVRRSAAVKAGVVAEDERESGLRAILNYGHTIGHALEAAAGYAGFLHGEAVAAGMMAAARIGVAMGVSPPWLPDRQAGVLRRFGLPLRLPGVDAARVLASISLDKKVAGRAVRWVLLADVGRPVIRDDVPLALVERAVQEATG